MAKQPPLTTQAIGIIGFLTLQYLLGMTTNMFVKFPNTTNEGKLWEFAWTQIPLAAHIILGFGLLIASISLLFRAIKQKDRLWIRVGTVGLLGIFVAGFAGSRFIPTQQDGYSFVMALAFIISLLSYVWGIYRSKK